MRCSTLRKNKREIIIKYKVVILPRILDAKYLKFLSKIKLNCNRWSLWTSSVHICNRLKAVLSTPSKLSVRNRRRYLYFPRRYFFFLHFINVMSANILNQRHFFALIIRHINHFSICGRQLWIRLYNIDSASLSILCRSYGRLGSHFQRVRGGLLYQIKI